jgi:hypothetical protein
MGWYVGYAWGCPDMIELWKYRFILMISAYKKDVDNLVLIKMKETLSKILRINEV